MALKTIGFSPFPLHFNDWFITLTLNTFYHSWSSFQFSIIHFSYIASETVSNHFSNYFATISDTIRSKDSILYLLAVDSNLFLI